MIISHMGKWIMITDTQIKTRIAEAIKYSGMKKVDIAKALNIHPSVIYMYIKGEKLPSLQTLANLCKLIAEDANYILCQE